MVNNGPDILVYGANAGVCDYGGGVGRDWARGDSEGG